MPDPKKSLSNFEWRCLDLVKKAEKFIEDRKDNGLSPRNMKVAEGHVEDLKDQFRRMNKKWQDDLEEKVFNDDENLYDELNKKVNDTKALVDKCVEDLENMLDKNESGASVQKAMKLENSFKPNPGLTISNTLEEFNAWKRAFEAYYGVNKEYLEAANPEIRRQFLHNCIDSKIQAAMITDDTLKIDTPIMGEKDSLLTWLKDHFLRDLPLFIRRYHYSNCHQRPGESFGDWWTRKLLKAEECNLDTVKKEDIQVTELICGISDPKLRDKFLKLQDPKLAELVAMGKRFDTASKLQKDNFSEDIRVNKAQSDYKKSKNLQWQQKGQESDQSEDPDEPKVRAKCQYCGKSHGSKTCWAKDSECLLCHEKGHYKVVCPKRGKKAVDANTVKVGRCIVEEIEDLDRLDDISRLKAKTSHLRGGKGERYSNQASGLGQNRF